MVILRVALTILFIVLFPGWALSAPTTHYVDNNAANDSGAGSAADPWKHCPGMIGWAGTHTLESGDTVKFDSSDTWVSAGATYGDMLYTLVDNVYYDGKSWGGGTGAKFQANGTSGYGHSSVVMIQNSNITFYGFVIDVNGKDIGGIYIGFASIVTNVDMADNTIDSCEIYGATYHTSGGGTYALNLSGMSGKTLNNTKVLNTYVHDNEVSGICSYSTWGFINTVDGVLFDNCRSINNIRTGASPSGNCMSVKNNSKNVVISNSEMSGCMYGLDIETTSEKQATVLSGPTNVVVKNNYIHGNKYTGITSISLELPTTVDIYGNIFNDDAVDAADRAEIVFIANGNLGTIEGTVWNIYNNTFYNTGTATGNSYSVINIQRWEQFAGDADINIYNNIMYSTNWPAIFDRNRFVNHSNNLMYRSHGAEEVVVTDYEPTGDVSAPATVTVTHHGSVAYDSSTGDLTSGEDVTWVNPQYGYTPHNTPTGLTGEGTIYFSGSMASPVTIYWHSGTPPADNSFITGVTSGKTIILSATPTLYTYFDKTGGEDWRTKFATGSYLSFSGLSSGRFKSVYVNAGTTADQINTTFTTGATRETVDNVVITEYAPVNYHRNDLGDVAGTWEQTAQSADPSFSAHSLASDFITTSANVVGKGAWITGFHESATDYYGYPFLSPVDIGAIQTLKAGVIYRGVTIQ